MIHIASIEVRGTSDRGRFRGRLPDRGTKEFARGLQVISGRNGFGKTLASRAIAWCLNLEPIFGRRDSDHTFFPLAAYEEIELGDEANVRVQSSEATLMLVRDDGERLELTRGITHDRNKVRIARRGADGDEQVTLLTGLGSMVDAATGFQRYLFEWLGWPLIKVTAYDGSEPFIYVENLGPLFYIEQDEGWTEIEARQISRYGQQQIRELSVEYLLGALQSVQQRVAGLRAASQDVSLRSAARTLAERVQTAFLRQGWAVDWSGNGSVQEIEARWSGHTIRAALKRDAKIDLSAQRDILVQRVVALRRALTVEPVDPANITASGSSSQIVVDLKQKRHRLNDDLRTLQIQFVDNEHLLESLDHRIQAATDVHRLKTTNVGRLSHLECPTCHRALNAEDFNLTEQTAPEVLAHIEALKRDRALIKRSLDGMRSAIRASEGARERLDADFRSAEQALEDVQTTVGPAREQLVRTASELSTQERRIERLDATAAELDELQRASDAWLFEAKAARPAASAPTDILERKRVFAETLGQYLIALGHSGALSTGVTALRFEDGQYEPYLGQRRVRSLGSGSDPARLVAAYTLALAAAGRVLQGALHPGVVILDEPLQQNPDEHHHRLFLDFLQKSLAKDATFQTLVFTFLREPEVEELVQAGAPLINVDWHFLEFDVLPPPPEAPGNASLETAEGGQADVEEVTSEVDVPPEAVNEDQTPDNDNEKQ